MTQAIVALNTATDACLTDSQESPSTVDKLHEPFLSFVPNSELSFEDKSTVFCSLVALVKEDYPFDDALQDKAVQFLKNLESPWGSSEYATKLLFDLVPSSDGSPSGFIERLVTLLSYPPSIVVITALSLLNYTLGYSSTVMKCRFVESDLVTNILSNLQPHTLPIAGNEKLFEDLTDIINEILFTFPSSPKNLNIIQTVDAYNRCEMMFQKVVIPSSPFLNFLISNRNILKEKLFDTFMTLIQTLILKGPFHQPTLSFVLSSPIAMAFPSCLALIEGFPCTQSFTKPVVINK